MTEKPEKTEETEKNIKHPQRLRKKSTENQLWLLVAPAIVLSWFFVSRQALGGGLGANSYSTLKASLMVICTRRTPNWN